jgi:succinate dehydrogenase / fumarate reductase cytochrome b subunit
MTPRVKVLASSIGTKLIIGVTGILLFLYLILHLAGNALVFLGPGVFNEYSHWLLSNPLVVPIEIGLLLVFLIHIYKTVTMWVSNRGARPVKYERKEWAGAPSRKNAASSSMILTGVLLFVFVMVHVKTFKYGPHYEVAGQPDVRDLYRLELENFSRPLAVGAYMICMILVGFHLWHGFASAFQSLGIDHPRYTPAIRTVGKFFAIVIAGGFLIIPIWVYLYGGGL